MKLDRRFLLRGTCQGALAVVGMPFLDCFLDSKGKALAATGRPLPSRFGTYFYGLGLTKQLWIPKVGGTDYEMTMELKPLEPFRKKLNVFSGLRVPLDTPENMRVESRFAGSDANPYLAMAATLACGLLGIRERLAPDAPVTGSAKELGYDLPRSLGEALDAAGRVGAIASIDLKPADGETTVDLARAVIDQVRRSRAGNRVILITYNDADARAVAAMALRQTRRAHRNSVPRIAIPPAITNIPGPGSTSMTIPINITVPPKK